MKISGSLKSTIGIGSNDFLKTEFVTGPSQPADGVSNLLVGLQLKNSDNSPVADYQPEFKVASGSNVTTSGCTKSDKNGVSACILTAIVAGERRLVLKNAKVGLEQKITFTAPEGARLGAVVPGAINQALATGGAKVSFSFGETFHGINQVTQGGYLVRMSVHGARSSR